MLLAPAAPWLPDGFQYALDNGAWTAYSQERPWDEGAFRALVAKYGEDADWIVAPDIVGDGLKSLDLSLTYFDWLHAQTCLVLLAVQDGMIFADVESVLGPRTGVFIGGSTEWKEQAIPVWGPWCAERGVWCHVGRVNARRRIRSCALARCTSFDGSSGSRFSVNVPWMDEERRQGVLLW